MKKLIILLSILALNENKNSIYCDIKGNVKKPGVYEIKENYTIQDVINDAGGLKKNSYTDNINLSRKVTDEMVIYIFSDKEIKDATKLNNCICPPTYKYIECEKEDDKVEDMPTTSTTQSITTTKTTTIPTSTTKSIETTTKKIIQIETTTPNITDEKTTTKVIESTIININTATLEELTTLKGLGEKKAQAIIEYRKTKLFETIEDIMLVSGIGETTFEKIKEFIEV